MKFDVAKQPERLHMVQWDGSNVEEVNEYIASVNDPTGHAEVVVTNDGAAYVDTQTGEKPLVPGALVHAVAYM